MRRSRAAVGPVAGLFLLCFTGCGDVAGDPILRARTDDGLSTDPPPMTDGQLATGPVLGLCEGCSVSSECGDGNDFCVRYRDSGERVCTRDCNEGRGCPEGYACVGLSNSSVRQCAPASGTCRHRGAIELAPPLGMLRATALQEINRARQRLALPALVADECLQEIAQTSARELALTGAAGAKYARECASVLPDCACGWAAEYQVNVADYALLWDGALMQAVDQGFLATGGNGTSAELGSSSYGRIGVGVLLGGDEAWISFALGN